MKFNEITLILKKVRFFLKEITKTNKIENTKKHRITRSVQFIFNPNTDETYHHKNYTKEEPMNIAICGHYGIIVFQPKILIGMLTLFRGPYLIDLISISIF